MTDITPNPNRFALVPAKKKAAKENKVIKYNPIGEEKDKMTEQVLDEMSQKAYDAGRKAAQNKKKKENPFELGSRKRAFYNQGFAHGKVAAKGLGDTLKTKWISNKLRNESEEIQAKALDEALEAFDGSDEMTESFLKEYGNSNGDDRGGSPTAGVPTTKTGILSQLSDWGLSNEYTGAASHMEYSALKALVGQATKDTVNDIFKKALGDAANTKGVDTMDKDKEASGQVSEHLNAIFNGTELTEEGKTKITTVFEAAVAALVKEEVAKIEEEALEEIELRVEEVETSLVEKMDQYLSYVAEEWKEENKLALESAIKTEMTESFIADLRVVFENHNIDIPASKVDALAEATARLDEVSKKLDETIKKNIELGKSLTESKKEKVFSTVSEGLVLTEVEKLKTLVEKVEFESEEDYTNKVKTIRESYFNKQTLTEDTDDKGSKKKDKTLIEDKKVAGKTLLDTIPNRFVI